MGRTETASQLIQELRPDGAPVRRQSNLIRNNQSFQMTLMKRAVVESERSLEDPGQVDQYYFEDEDMVVIDLQTDE